MKRILIALMLILSINSFAIAETATSSLQEMYAEAELLMVQGDYVNAAAKFEALSAYSDAAQMTLYCKAIYAANMGMYVASVDALSSLGQFKDAPQLAQYYTACSYLEYAKSGNTNNLVNIELYKEIFTENIVQKFKNPNYETTDEQLIYCFLAKDIFTELSLYKDSLMKVAECEARATEIIEAENAVKEAKYQEALTLENEGKYDEALKIYETLHGYKDSYDRILTCETKIAEIRKETKYQEALAFENEGRYEEAIEIYKSLGSYKDYSDRIAACESAICADRYQKAILLEDNGEYTSALNIYLELGENYEDCAERIKNCEFQLEPTQVVWGFSEGLAAIEKNLKWGYINTNGECVIPCQFDMAQSFSCGRARVIQDGKSGFINTNGEIVVPCQWDLAYTFNDNLAFVENDAYSGLIDLDGNKVIIPGNWEKTRKYSEGLVQVQKDGKWGYATLEGELVVDCVWDSVSIFSEGMAVVSKNKMYGYIDTEGNEVIPCQWEYAFDFNSGVACVRNSSSEHAYIDYYGNIVHPFGKFGDKGFEGGIYCNGDVGKAGCYDIKGNVVIEPIYELAFYGEGYFTLLKDGELTILSREEVQPGWEEEMESYQAELAQKRADIKVAAEQQKMLREYTDKETVKKAQAALNEAGYLCGTPDGAAGKKTIAALTQYQTDKGLTVTGTITHETLISIGLAS